jgi:tetratricopeptide (TPR) repeat protein
MELWAQVLTGMELDEHDAVRVLNASTWQERRQRLQELGGPPLTVEEDPVAWHEREVKECESAKQWFAAFWHLDRLIRAQPANWKRWVKRALAHHALSQWDQAIADYTKAIELKPDSRPAWYNRGLAYDNQGQWDKAVVDYTKVIELDPNYDLGWHGRGVVYQRLRQWDKAVADLSRAIELNPNNSGALWSRGVTYACLGQWDKATADLQKTSELKPDDGRPQFAHAQMLLGAGNTDSYCTACASLMDRFGQTNDPSTANSTAWVCALVPNAVKEPDRLVQLAERAVASNPKSSSYLNTLGAALYRAGRFEAAVQRLQEAIKAEGKEGTAWDWLFLAMAYQRLGKAEEARSWLDKAGRWIDQKLQEKPREGAAGSLLRWDQQLELQLLRREAEALLQKPAEKPKK